MDIKEYEELVADPARRQERYTAMLPEFYDLVTQPYRTNWADSFHLPPFTGQFGLAEALRRHEHKLARDAGFVPGMRILDIGCGIGGPALSIAAASGCHVTGVNIVPMHVEIARDKAREQGLEDRTEFVVGDMTGLRFPDESFDGAFSFDAICHAPDKSATYAEIHRVLKPGSVFTGCDWLCTDGLSHAEYQEWIEPICVTSALPDIRSIGETRQLLTEAGFEVETCRDLAEDGDMTPNWQLFEQAADTIPAPRSGERKMLWRHAVSTARGGRSGKFKIGYWKAHRP